MPAMVSAAAEARGVKVATWSNAWAPRAWCEPRGLISGLLRLHWSAPSKAFPHGLSGLASSCIGAYLIIPALSGNIDLVRSAPLLLYVAAAIVNALAGIAIAGRAPKKYRPAFRLCAAFQCCLVYFVWRFSPGFPFGGTLVSAAMDALVGALLLLGIVAIALFSLLSLPLVLGVAISIGSAALALLAGYPLQLAVLGEEWWQCVQADYPLQSEAMVAYIYIPATWAFGLMLFGATLWTRNLIGDLGLGAGFAGVVMSTLVATVLFQRYGTRSRPALKSCGCPARRRRPDRGRRGW